MIPITKIVQYFSPRGVPVPARIIGGLRRYFESGYSPGSFLGAILENKLGAACEYAGAEDRDLIYDIYCLIQDHLPSECRGDAHAVSGWIRIGFTGSEGYE